MTFCPHCGIAGTHNGPCPLAPPDNRRILQNRYEIREVLGQGGMGKVYTAADLRLEGRRRVVKQLRDDHYRKEDHDLAIEFFKREYKLLSTLEHPSIVQILDHFEENGQYYIVMEYIEGNNLHEVLTQHRQEPFSEEEVLTWAIEICDVLTYLHGLEPAIIYRDLKPSNIMLDSKDRLKLIDFGIARKFDEDGKEVTKVVSAGYSPPEQYWGQASPASDIYALGATMHFLLTGKEPEALHRSSPAMLNSEVSDICDAIVQKATAQDPQERYENVEQLMHDCQQALALKQHISIPRSRLGEMAFGVVLIVVAGLIWFFQPQINAMLAGTTPPPLPGTAQPGTDTAAPRTAASGQKPSENDFAAQVTDEQQLTDPEGLR
ncbi:MAG: protein kinase [Candidatus Obscuribacterales bacterium]